MFWYVIKIHSHYFEWHRRLNSPFLQVSLPSGPQGGRWGPRFHRTSWSLFSSWVWGARCRCWWCWGRTSGARWSSSPWVSACRHAAQHNHLVTWHIWCSVVSQFWNSVLSSFSILILSVKQLLHTWGKIWIWDSVQTMVQTLPVETNYNRFLIND